MQFIAKSLELDRLTADCIVVAVFSENRLSKTGKEIDALSQGYLSKLLQLGDMTGDCGQTLLVPQIPELNCKRILLMGCGKEAEFNEIAFRKTICKSVAALKSTNAQEIAYFLDDLILLSRDLVWKIRIAAEVISDALYVFDEYKSKKEPVLRAFQTVVFSANSAELISAETAVQVATAIANGVRFVKNLGNTPANVCTPKYLAEQAALMQKKNHSINVNIHDVAAIKELKMGAFLAVAQGSHQSPELIVLQYSGAAKDVQPIALVGKGVTFDTGGISLKPSAGMEEMKYDMCGAATVLGVIQAAAELKLPINLVGIIPATENMPGGRATKPGDIVTTMSGQTVEILNTDAEGRLILCDALTFAERFKPKAVIDIATLTGAMVVTLGAVASGYMYNDKTLADALEKAAAESGDKIWPLPIWEEYQDLIKSPAADMANLGEGMGAKSIASACFLARFTKNYPWAHLDIAGTAWGGKEKGATGRPVALLVQYLLDRC